MERKIKARQDLLSGLLFVLVGVAFLVLSWRLPLGSARQMGPAYIPVGSALILVLIGTAIMMRGYFRDGRGVTAIAWRPLVLIPIAALAFGLSLERLGLVVSIFLAVTISRFAMPRAALAHTLLLAGGLSIFCVLLFVHGFGTPVPAWPALR